MGSSFEKQSGNKAIAGKKPASPLVWQSPRSYQVFQVECLVLKIGRQALRNRLPQPYISLSLLIEEQRACQTQAVI